MSGATLAQLAVLCAVNKPPGVINPRLRCISCTDSTILIYPNAQSRDISSLPFLVNHHTVQYEVKRCSLNGIDKRVHGCTGARVHVCTSGVPVGFWSDGERCCPAERS